MQSCPGGYPKAGRKGSKNGKFSSGYFYKTTKINSAGVIFNVLLFHTHSFTFCFYGSRTQY